MIAETGNLDTAWRLRIANDRLTQYFSAESLIEALKKVGRSQDAGILFERFIEKFVLTSRPHWSDLRPLQDAGKEARKKDIFETLSRQARTPEQQAVLAAQWAAVRGDPQQVEDLTRSALRQIDSADALLEGMYSGPAEKQLLKQANFELHKNRVRSDCALALAFVGKEDEAEDLFRNQTDFIDKISNATYIIYSLSKAQMAGEARRFVNLGLAALHGVKPSRAITSTETQDILRDFAHQIARVGSATDVLAATAPIAAQSEVLADTATIMLNRGDPEGAKRLAREAASIDPHSAHAANALAFVGLPQDSLAQAERALVWASQIADDKQRSSVYAEVAETFARLNDQLRARRAADLCPLTEGTLSGYAAILRGYAVRKYSKRPQCCSIEWAELPTIVSTRARCAFGPDQRVCSP